MNFHINSVFSGPVVNDIIKKRNRGTVMPFNKECIYTLNKVMKIILFDISESCNTQIILDKINTMSNNLLEYGINLSFFEAQMFRILSILSTQLSLKNYSNYPNLLMYDICVIMLNLFLDNFNEYHNVEVTEAMVKENLEVFVTLLELL